MNNLLHCHFSNFFCKLIFPNVICKNSLCSSKFTNLHVLREMRDPCLALLVKNHNNQREILNIYTVWYSITPFCLTMPQQHPPLASTSGKEYLVNGWTALLSQLTCSQNKMPCLVSRTGIQVFYHPGQIWISAAMVKGTIKEIQTPMNNIFNSD